MVLGTPGGQKAELPRRCFETICSDIGILVKNALGRRHGYILLLKCSLKPLSYKFSRKKFSFVFFPIRQFQCLLLQSVNSSSGVTWTRSLSSYSVELISSGPSSMGDKDGRG